MLLVFSPDRELMEVRTMFSFQRLNPRKGHRDAASTLQKDNFKTSLLSYEEVKKMFVSVQCCYKRKKKNLKKKMFKTLLVFVNLFPRFVRVT